MLLSGGNTVSEEKALVERVMAALAEGNDQPFLDAMGEDFKWTWMGSGDLSHTFGSKESVLNELWKSVKADIVQPFKMRATRIIAEGEYVVVEGRGSNVTAKGKEYCNRYCWIVRVVDGKLADLSEYMDTELVRNTF